MTGKKTTKYVVEETMGDGTVFIKVKFVHSNYLFGQLISSTEEYDPIIFNSTAEAEQYAKNVMSPSRKISYSDAGYNNYSNDYQYDIKDIKIYKPNTIYDNALSDLINTYNNLAQADNYYAILYITGYYKKPDIYAYYGDDYVNIPKRDTWKYFSTFVIKNIEKNSRILYLNTTLIENWENVLSVDSLKDKFGAFKKYIDDNMQKVLDEERMKRLSKTLISANEKMVDSDDNDNVDIAIKSITTEYDIERNKLIEAELKRVSDYQNFLKKLIK